jgi:hypothetical protein
LIVSYIRQQTTRRATERNTEATFHKWCSFRGFKSFPLTVVRKRGSSGFDLCSCIRCAPFTAMQQRPFFCSTSDVRTKRLYPQSSYPSKCPSPLSVYTNAFDHRRLRNTARSHFTSSHTSALIPPTTTIYSFLQNPKSTFMILNNQPHSNQLPSNPVALTAPTWNRHKKSNT